MIYNLREKGKVHRVSDASRFAHRDKRRSVWLARRWGHQLRTILCDKGVAATAWAGQADVLEVLPVQSIGHWTVHDD